MKEDAYEIEIQGNLAKKRIKIRAPGKVAWLVAAGAIGVVAYATATTLGSGGAGASATVPVAVFQQIWL